MTRYPNWANSQSFLYPSQSAGSREQYILSYYHPPLSGPPSLPPPSAPECVPSDGAGDLFRSEGEAALIAHLHHHRDTSLQQRLWDGR